MKRLRFLWLLLLTGMILTVGCTTVPSVKGLHDLIGIQNYKLSSSAKAFYTTLAPLASGQNVDIGAVRTAYNGVKTALGEANLTFFGMLPPRASPTGEKTLAAYKRFLEKQSEVFDQCITPMLQIAEDAQMTPQQKWAKIVPLLTQATQIESEPMQALGKTLGEFQSDHKLGPNLDPKSAPK